MKTCYVIGGGPSLEGFDWELLRGCDVIGCNDSILLPIPVKYGVMHDYDWAQAHRDGLRSALDKGTQVLMNTMTTGGKNKVDKRIAHVRTNEDLSAQNYLELSAVPSYGNSGFAAMCLAAKLGYERICMLGFDGCYRGRRSHWHEPFRNQGPAVYGRFRKKAPKVADALSTYFPNVQVLNMHPEGREPSEYECWERCELEIFPSDPTMQIQSLTSELRGTRGPLQSEHVITWVYKTGGIYDQHAEECIRSQYEGLKKTPCELQYVCLTDDENLPLPPGVRRVPLKYDLKGWFSKFELFRTDIFLTGQKVVFFDLDTHINGSILPILDLPDDHFYMLRDFYYPDKHGGSGVMVFDANQAEFILNKFLRHKDTYSYASGDQVFITKTVQPSSIPLRKLQNVCNDTIYSYKVHVSGGEFEAHECPILCFHGNPRPWDVRTK